MKASVSALFFGAILSTCLAVAAQDPPLPPDATVGNAPHSLTSFAGIRPNDTVVDRWTVRDLSIRGREITIALAEPAKEVLRIVVSLESGRPGAFDTGGVRIYYENSTLPHDSVVRVGTAVSERIAAFGGEHGGLRTYVGGVVEQERNAHPEQNISRETARRFLDQLAGKWTVTALQWVPDKAAPRTIGTGKAERRRFVNDLILREDLSGARGSQFLMVGCSPEAARCWLFVVDDTSSGFIGGWGVFSESENALKVSKLDSREPIVVLRIVDRNRNILEFYEPGGGTLITRTMRYDRAK